MTATFVEMNAGAGGAKSTPLNQLPPFAGGGGGGDPGPQQQQHPQPQQQPQQQPAATSAMAPPHLAEHPIQQQQPQPQQPQYHHPQPPQQQQVQAQLHTHAQAQQQQVQLQLHEEDPTIREVMGTLGASFPLLSSTGATTAGSTPLMFASPPPPQHIVFATAAPHPHPHAMMMGTPPPAHPHPHAHSFVVPSEPPKVTIAPVETASSSSSAPTTQTTKKTSFLTNPLRMMLGADGAGSIHQGFKAFPQSVAPPVWAGIAAAVVFVLLTLSPIEKTIGDHYPRLAALPHAPLVVRAALMAALMGVAFEVIRSACS